VNKTKKILFISYDGMTDPLGQSQVLPYIIGLSRQGYEFTILSCEKPERYEKNKSTISALLSAEGIEWETIPFTTKPPIIAKYIDIASLRRKAIKLQRKNQFDMVHCRSYIAADIGVMLKKKYGIKYFFDMRGFWVDERVDGGLWNMKNPLYKAAFEYYKYKEGEYINNADYIISLTEAGKYEIQQWKSYANNPIGVIPCSADFNLFSLTSLTEKQKARKELGISDESLVLSYLGSIGTWYLLDEMLEFFGELKKTYTNAIFLFITPEKPAYIIQKAKQKFIKEEDLIIRFALRSEVPVLTKASDINISFIKPSYSKIASSPTKLGEVLAMGIPVICNSRVGDVKQIIEQTVSGITLEEFSKESYKEAIEKIPDLLEKDAVRIREKAFLYYDLNKAIKDYTSYYQTLLR
jgi:glycosyltransferase involved in cell wall biosynthesis